MAAINLRNLIVTRTVARPGKVRNDFVQRANRADQPPALSLMRRQQPAVSWRVTQRGSGKPASRLVDHDPRAVQAGRPVGWFGVSERFPACFAAETGLRRHAGILAMLACRIGRSARLACSRITGLSGSYAG